MQVRQLIGPYAGQIVEMPYIVAQNCVASGTACWLGDEHRNPVKGTKMAEPETAPEPEPPVANESVQAEPEVEAAEPAEPVAEEKPRRRKTKRKAANG